jgi:hypothetical protein
MNTRQLAIKIVRLRRLLQLGMIAELRDDVDEYDRLLADFDALAQTLPIFVRLDHRVTMPSQRKVQREGILAQAASVEHVHHYQLRSELDTWLCDCGASYMGARR